ncbi:MAG: MFS transporter [Coprothermobacterota bacterium]|nr:MFS transporter [Coprothermobacterota bacterium]
MEITLTRKHLRRPAGMAGFLVVWSGQLVSLVGTGMTNFAFAIYIWQTTGQATPFALIGFFFALPLIGFTPFAGALVDRWNRKLTMMISDIAGLVVNLAYLSLLLWGHLEMWHLYVLVAFNGLFLAFQWPAYSAAISTMLEKKHFGRANALMSVAQSGSTIMAPVLAAILMVSIGLSGIILLDSISFLAAILTLAIVAIPQPPKTELGEKSKSNLFREAAYGFRYIFRVPSLLGLQLTFFFGNLLSNLVGVLYVPMILARTANNAGALATVETVLGIGGVLGGILISIWGGPKRRINGVIGGWFLSFCGILAVGMVSGVVAWAIAGFFFAFVSPLISSSNQALWQSKIPPEIQGKVFSARSLIAQVASPFSMIIAGPLADRIFGPAMLPGGALAGSLGPLFGVGVGSGMSLMIAVAGLLGMVVAASCYLVPVIRNVERLVPDFQLPEAPTEEPHASGAAPAREGIPAIALSE